MTDDARLVPFSFGIPTRILFGINSAADLATECRRSGWASAFVVMDPGIQRAGVAGAALRSLADAGIEVTLFTEVEPNPVDRDIEAGAKVFAARQSDVIIGIGGGSALDTAKGIAVLATNGGQVADYDGTDKVPADAWPFVCIPTTAGTGSEVTRNISVTNAVTHDKMSIRSDRSFARLALLDPGLLVSLPRSVAAASGMDALVHAVEGYVSTRGNALTDALALEAIRLISGAIEPFVQDRSNLDLASTMLCGSCLAGMVITHTGTGIDHAIARALGGHFSLVHGVACGVLLEPVMRFNLPAVQDRYARIGDVMKVTEPGMSLRARAEAAIQRVHEIRKAVGLPDRLAVDVSGAVGREVVEAAVRNRGPNPQPATGEDVRRILAEVTAA